MNAIVGTWKMSLRGVREAQRLLFSGGGAGDAVARAITDVEDDPAFRSVGYGGLPGRDGRVTLDAGFMDGDTLRVGAVMSAEHIKNPILAAKMLCGRKTDCVLAGRGAEEFAVRQGLALRDMLAPDSARRWRERLRAVREGPDAPAGHDTVCVLALDGEGRMAAGTSTSGLFMKENGRVGDSPLVGSGFYCDGRYGAAAATGLGEEIMRGCLSYEIVSLMKRGRTPEEACREALRSLTERVEGSGGVGGAVSVIALSRDGAFGAATTLPCFPFAAGRDGEPLLYAAGSAFTVRRAQEEELLGID